MQKLQILVISLFLFSCQNEMTSKEKTSEDTSIDSTKENSNSEVLEQKIDSTKIPSNTFLKLVDFINESGYTHDTTFIKKVTTYRYSDSVINTNGKLFYFLKPEETLILDFCKINNLDPYNDPYQMFKEDLYKKAKHVFAYYYRENKMDDFVNDGIIEEWYFEDSLQAENALIDFKSKNHVLIANTSSFGKRQNNKLYIMYTRSAGFGIFLDKVYQELKQLIK